MDNISGTSQKDLAESSDKFITGVYKEIAKRAFKSHLRKASQEDDITKGIDYYSVAGTIQFKELKSGIDRYCFDLESWPFETEVKNKYGQIQKGWVYHTEARYLIFIRTIRITGEWWAVVFDWKKMREYILTNIRYSKINRFGSAKNQMFTKEELKDYLVEEINNNSALLELT
jgi:hypothetical protein